MIPPKVSGRTVCIIQARLSSTRLPRKVMLPLEGRLVLQHVISRLEKSKLVDQVVVATTRDDIDDELEVYCQENGIPCFRGDREDVLSRFYECAKECNATDVVRVTSDCPLVDPNIVDDVIRLFRSENADYGANSMEKTYPHGLDVEVLTFRALSHSHFKAKEPFEREHVTQYVRHRPEEYKLVNLSSEEELHDIRVTLDEEEDFQLIKLVMRLKGDDVDFDGIKSVFKEFPLLKDINTGARGRHDVYNRKEKIR